MDEIQWVCEIIIFHLTLELILHSASTSLGLSQELRGGATAVQNRSGAVVFALVGVRVVAVAVLAVLLLSN